MRTRLEVLAIILLTLSAAHGQKATWNLSKDIGVTGNQISFNQGANGVWYFLQSSGFAHDPKTYKFLEAYNEPCIGDSTTMPVSGIACWQTPSPDSSMNRVPTVGFNFTYRTQALKYFAIPPRSVIMHPSTVGLGLIGWKSPITGSVEVAGQITDLDPICGNGILWSVDKGSQRLTSVDLPNGGGPVSFEVPSVAISKGQVLYFAIDPKAGDYGCDTTMLDLTIKELD